MPHRFNCHGALDGIWTLLNEGARYPLATLRRLSGGWHRHFLFCPLRDWSKKGHFPRLDLIHRVRSALDGKEPAGERRRTVRGQSDIARLPRALPGASTRVPVPDEQARLHMRRRRGTLVRRTRETGRRRPCGPEISGVWPKGSGKVAGSSPRASAVAPQLDPRPATYPVGEMSSTGYCVSFLEGRRAGLLPMASPSLWTK